MFLGGFTQLQLLAGHLEGESSHYGCTISRAKLPRG
jgi:hypothetical protein